MPTDTAGGGRCPNDDAEIPEAWHLVEYTTDSGKTGVWAECPACGEVVAPE
jgi:hypothetical protein